MVDQEQMGQRIPIEPWEVGGELLDILSKGLYTDARDALREFVQNSVDAHASTVHITFEGPVVTVRDDGEGMDFDTLRRARRLGASDKGMLFNVGFRGIGIYSAFGMCEALTIQTHQSNSKELLTLRMNFGAMSRVLEQDRDAPRRSGIALTALLSEHTGFWSSTYTGKRDDQFTMVRLEGLRQEYRSQLSILSDVHGYLLNTLPVLFPEIGYGPLVNQWLRDFLNLNPVRVVLRIGSEPEVVVEPQVAEKVHEPQFAYVKDADDRNLAFVWHAMSTTREQVNSDRGGFSNSHVSGFLLKARGFTLGDRGTIKHLWPLVGARALYHHYTGEIHILDEAGTIPNAARNDLEAGRPRDVLFRHLQDTFAVLNSSADVARQILKITDDISTAEDEAQRLLEKANDPDDNQFELYRLARNFAAELEGNVSALDRLKSRGRSGRAKLTFPPSEAQVREITELRDRIRAPRNIARRVVDSTANRTKSKAEDRAVQSRQPPAPQVVLLQEASNGFAEMVDALPPEMFGASQESLATALRLQTVPNAIAVLDEVKAAGFDLTENVESVRRRLRSYLGWSPNAPVSLLDALAKQGFLTSTERETDLIQAIDAGMRRALGGRGEAYENLLRSIVDAVQNHPHLG